MEQCYDEVKLLVKNELSTKLKLFGKQITRDESKPMSIKIFRESRFDGLRAIGLLAIILAHTSAPDRILQLRNFDVPLMIMVSGSVYTLSAARKNLGYFQYLWRRMNHLLAPTWIFLTCFFLFNALVAILSKTAFPYTFQDIKSTYDLISGIGYVWIFRVMILVAMVLPLLYWLSRRLRALWFWVVLAVVYGGYEWLFSIYPHLGIDHILSRAQSDL